MVVHTLIVRSQINKKNTVWEGSEGYLRSGINQNLHLSYTSYVRGDAIPS